MGFSQADSTRSHAGTPLSVSLKKISWYCKNSFTQPIGHSGTAACVYNTTQQKKSTTSESAGFRAVAAMYVVVMSHSPGCSKKVEGSQGSKKKDWCDSNSFNLEKKISEKKLLCNITSGGILTKWRSWSEMHLCSKLNYHQKIVFYSCCAGQILAKKGRLRSSIF